jgi:hypothetical protein
MDNDQPNELLRTRREALPSPSGSGEPTSGAELAHDANEYLAPRRAWAALDGDTIATYERGTIHRPRAARREALRAVLGAGTDADLGFYNSWQTRGRHDPENTTMREATPDAARSPQDDLERLAIVVPMPGASQRDVPVTRQAVGNNPIVTISAAPQADEAPYPQEVWAGRTSPAAAVGGAEPDSSAVTIRGEIPIRDIRESSES